MPAVNMEKALKSSKSKVNKFRKVFASTLGEHETIVYDCSCALVKEILIHGRLYVTQNHICFYGQFFKWSRSIVINFSDVLSINKIKKLRFSAMEVATSSGKNYLFSFLPRLKAHFLKITSVWQNFTSSTSLESKCDTLDSISDNIHRTNNTPVKTPSPKIIESRTCLEFPKDHQNYPENTHLKCFFSPVFNPEELDFLSISASSKTDVTCSYQGKASMILSKKFSANPDKLFEMLFIKKFGWEYCKENSICYTRFENWKRFEANTPTIIDGQKVICSRELEFSIQISYPFPKSVFNTEKQYLVSYNPNHSYTVKFVVQSSGLPLASSFYTITTMCIMKGSQENECNIHLHFDMIFLKRTWGMQSFIYESSLHVSRDIWNQRATHIQQIIQEDPENFSQPGINYCLFSECLLQKQDGEKDFVVDREFSSFEDEISNETNKNGRSQSIVTASEKTHTSKTTDKMITSHIHLATSKSNPANLSSFAFLLLILILAYLAFVPSILNLGLSFICNRSE